MKPDLCSLVALFFATVALAEDTKTVTISNEGTAVMTISAPQTAKVMTVIETKDLVLNLWSCPRPRRSPRRSRA